MNLPTLNIVEAVKELLAAYGYVIYVWHVDDVHCLCEQNALPKLSDDEAMDVFAIASQQFDGEFGMSWPQLEKALHVFLKRKRVLEEMAESES